MINLHVYPSPIVHESRIEREVSTIDSLGIFESIEVAGVSGPELPAAEPLGAHSSIRRFATETDSHGLLARGAKTLVFGHAVLTHYSSERLSVINCHSVAALPTCIALKRATGARLIYDPHELETESSASRGLRKPIYKTIERWGIRHVDHTFTVTKSIESWYRKAYGLMEIDTIYNYPSCAGTTRVVDKQYFRRKFSLPASTRVYLYQGVLGAGRGLEVVAAAFRDGLVKNGALVILGYGPWTPTVKEWSGSSNRIYFHPAVAPGELSVLTGAADVGLAPTVGSECLSYYLSAPNKLFQYWHAGIPVVASNLPEHARFMRRFKAGVITASDSVGSFVDACLALDAADQRAIVAGIASAAATLCWENYTDLFRRRYEMFTHQTRS